MKKSRFTETQIVGILNEAEAGTKVKDLCRKHGISDATYWTCFVSVDTQPTFAGLASC